MEAGTYSPGSSSITTGGMGGSIALQCWQELIGLALRILEATNPLEDVANNGLGLLPAGRVPVACTVPSISLSCCTRCCTS